MGAYQVFESTSRYNSCGDAFFDTIDGKTIRYKRRRFIPKEKEGDVVLLEISVVTGDRIDLISDKYLGDSQLFWKLCDMNGAMHPLDLTDRIGKTIRILGEE